MKAATPICNLLTLVVLHFCACRQPQLKQQKVTIEDATVDSLVSKDTVNIKQRSVLFNSSQIVDTRNLTREEILSFATSLIGTPYLYASTDPALGFDCSGFITYVFNHFDVAVPRSSIDFVNVGQEVSVENALPGDLVLFTGTDSLDTSVGHMGIVVSVNQEQLSFIHSTSGKANGVTVTPLNAYYKKRFVKVIKVFP